MPIFGQDPSAVGRNQDIDLIEISRWDTPIHARIDVFAYLATKRAASRAHASQYSGGPIFWRMLPKSMVQRLQGIDTYSRAYPAPNGLVETDLCAGLTY